MLGWFTWFARRPFEYVGLLQDHPVTDHQKLLEGYRTFFEEETKAYKERQGFITQITNNAVELNHRLDYPLGSEQSNFAIGDHVAWKEYKIDGEIVAKDVVLVSDKDKVKKTKLNGAKIVKIEGNKFVTNTGMIFYQNKVRCDLGFRPKLSDFVNMECSYMSDDVEDVAPECVNVERVSPGESKFITGKITEWDPSTNTGVINGKVVFHLDSCDQVLASLGVKVCCNCVKGQYEGYEWRAYEVKRHDNQIKPTTHTFNVEPIPKFDIVLGETKTVELCVSNTLSDRPCIVKSVEFFIDNVKVEINTGLKLPYLITPDTTVGWPLDVKGEKPGRHEFKTAWKISSNHRIVYSRFFFYVVHQNFEKLERTKTRGQASLVVRPQLRGRRPVFRSVPLREYPIPQRLREICHDEQRLDLIETQITLNKEYPFLAEHFSPENYGDHMHTMLYMEEMALETFFDAMATRGALIRGKSGFIFNFPADSSYSNLVCGDAVRASKPWEKGTQYEASITAIFPTSISLKFCESFENSVPSGAQFDLEFRLNRRPFQRLHQAVDLVLKNLGANWLLPYGHFIVDQDREAPIQRWYNPELNAEQKNAVSNILIKKNLPHPYIIYGPPGTGKTVTVVEAILQMMNGTNHRILVTAPTNSAVDTLGVRLLEYGVFAKEEMVRLTSYNAYISGQIAAQLMDISYVPSLGDPAHDTPLNFDTAEVPKLYLSDLGCFKILLGTLHTISHMNVAGFPAGFFTHIVVDEAGQCHEPESLLPIALVKPNETQLVLAGDPQQLGPTIRSVVAKQFSFDKSFLYRLTQTFMYRKKADDFRDTHGYNPALITKLVLSYRSLPKIVDLVGSTFYDGDLRPTICEENSREAQVLKKITIQGIELKFTKDSLIFINVDTPDEQIEGSQSWMNHGEVAQVFFLLNFLYAAKISPDDIGVITPYALQKKKIYEYLDALGALAPKVASVQEFQGQEKDIIILSLVRNNLGTSARLSPFVTDYHRVNVALSRARVLNIIVGNYKTLRTNELWKRIISKCHVLNLATASSRDFDSGPFPDVD